MRTSAWLLSAAIVLAAGGAYAQLQFEAVLNGSQESSPNASPATGFGTVILSPDQTHITVDESWTGLTAPATASHIHGPAAPGVSAGVLFPFSGVPAATSGSIPEQVFAITPQEVGELESGLLYMNVHTANFPGGEIRGQLTLVPEPRTLSLLAVGAVILGWHLRRKLG